jgi:hypothetical protein
MALQWPRLRSLSAIVPINGKGLTESSVSPFETWHPTCCKICTVSLLTRMSILPASRATRSNAAVTSVSTRWSHRIRVICSSLARPWCADRPVTNTPRPALSERAGDPAANAKGSTCDDGDFAVRMFHWDIFSCPSLKGGTRALPN